MEENIKTDITSLLLYLGVDVNDAGAKRGKTALHWAVTQGHLKSIKLLIVSGADPTIKNKNGQSAMDLAEGNAEILRLLTGDQHVKKVVVDQ